MHVPSSLIVAPVVGSSSSRVTLVVVLVVRGSEKLIVIVETINLLFPNLSKQSNF